MRFFGFDYVLSFIIGIFVLIAVSIVFPATAKVLDAVILGLFLLTGVGGILSMLYSLYSPSAE